MFFQKSIYLMVFGPPGFVKQVRSIARQGNIWKKKGWALCFSDCEDLCCLACVGLQGSIRQIAGPNESNQKDISKQRVSFAIVEIVWGQEVVCQEFAASSRGYFPRDEQFQRPLI